MKDLNDLVAVREEQYFLFSVLSGNSAGLWGDPHTPLQKRVMSLEESLSAAAKPDSKIPGRRNTVMILESEDLPVIKYCVTTRAWSVQKSRYFDD